MVEIIAEYMWKWNPEAPKSNTAGHCPATRQDTIILATAHASSRIYDADTSSDTAIVSGWQT